MNVNVKSFNAKDAKDAKEKLFSMNSFAPFAAVVDLRV